MKAKWNNKGYSLVELLITIVIFGIVMIGIALMMRTTSASYVSGNSEVAMQTEVQIVANQIEELLVDATGTVTSTATNEWKIPGSGATHYIMYDATNDELLYQKGGNAAANWSLMAEYISDFDIEGLAVYTPSGTLGADHDNMANIHIEMNNDGHAYEVDREVFFRNAIENPTVYLLNGGSTSTSTPTAAYAADIAVNRYQVLNLEKDYGIVTVTGVSGDFYGFYEFLDEPDWATGNKMLCYAITNVDSAATGTMTPYIRVNATKTVSYGSSTSGDIVVTGETSNGTVKQIRIYTEAVSFDVNATLDRADGAVYLANGTGDGKGGYTWIGMKGIDIASMIAINGAQYKYSMVCYVDSDTNQMYSYNTDNAPMTPETCSLTVAHGYDGQQSTKYSTIQSQCGLQQGFALGADPETNGFILVQDNNALSANSTATTAIAAGQLRLAIMIQLPDNNPSNDSSYMVVDLAVLNQGADLDNYKGVNTYSATYNSTSGAWTMVSTVLPTT